MGDLAYRFYETFIFDNRWQIFAKGLLMTLILTFASFLLGSLIGAIFCALRLKENKIISKVLSVVTGFLVQIPTLVLLMIFLYIIFSGAGISTVNVCIFGLTLKTSAYLSDIFYNAVTSVDPGEVEAARALGMSKTQAFLKITLPQAVNNGISIYQNQFVIALQETSIVGSLAVEELTKASNIVTSRTLDAMFGLICISIVYILIGAIGSWLFGLLNKQKHLGEEA